MGKGGDIFDEMDRINHRIREIKNKYPQCFLGWRRRKNPNQKHAIKRTPRIGAITGKVETIKGTG